MKTLVLMLVLQHEETDPLKCKTCKPALERAVAYVRAHYRSADVAGIVYAGLMFLMLDPNGPDLQACVQAAGRHAQNPFNNWYFGLSAYFLSEVYLRRPSAEIQGFLNAAMNRAGAMIEDTGGWCHNQGEWRRTNYHKQGGSRDLGMLTGMVFAAMVNMKAAGLELPEALFKKVEKNLEAISDGLGFKYGTDNGCPDFAMGRGAYVFLGLTNGGMDSHPFYDTIVQGLEKRYRDIERGHACACIHHFGVAAAMHRAGKYPQFAEAWIDKLIAKQAADGSISLGCDRGDQFADKTGNAAAFACILLLQKEGAFKPAERRRKVVSSPSAPVKKPPFSRK
jgi:hypothetical protein